MTSLYGIVFSFEFWQFTWGLKKRLYTEISSLDWLGVFLNFVWLVVGGGGWWCWVGMFKAYLGITVAFDSQIHNWVRKIRMKQILKWTFFQPAGFDFCFWNPNEIPLFFSVMDCTVLNCLNLFYIYRVLFILNKWSFSGIVNT